MIKKILVPVDFSTPSKYALEYAEWLAQSIDAQIIVLYIYTEMPDQLSEESKILFEQNLLVRLKRFATLYPHEHEDKVMPIQELECSVHKGNIVDGIVEKSLQEEVDLIIIGTHAKHSLWEQLTGSISYTLVTKSIKPILIIPEGTSFQPIKNIAFATANVSQEELLQPLNHIAQSIEAQVHPFFVNQLPADFSIEKEETWTSDEDTLYPSITMIRNSSIQKGIDDFLVAHPCEVLAMYLPHRSYLEKWLHVSTIKKQALSPQLPLLVFR